MNEYTTHLYMQLLDSMLQELFHDWSITAFYGLRSKLYICASFTSLILK